MRRAHVVEGDPLVDRDAFGLEKELVRASSPVRGTLLLLTGRARSHTHVVTSRPLSRRAETIVVPDHSRGVAVAVCFVTRRSAWVADETRCAPRRVVAVDRSRGARRRPAASL